MTQSFQFHWRHKPLCAIDDFRDAARRKLPRPVWAYIDGGAESETTLRRNRTAFDKWALHQRVLAGHKVQSLGVTIFGEALAMPLLLAPVGSMGLAHHHAEIAAARAAERHGTRLSVSNAGSYDIAEIAAATEHRPWFQLYPFGDREVMRHFMARARNAGIDTLIVTVDLATHGLREREVREGAGPPPVLTPASLLDLACKPRWVWNYLRRSPLQMPNFLLEGETAGRTVPAIFFRPDVMRPDLDWSDLQWIRDQWAGPMVIKGILHPDDAERAIGVGADAIIVSNHGGRQLDGAMATLDALPAIAARVNGRVQILMDGGIRRGSDIIKALCLGADACLIGRPYLYGLALRGMAGVEDVLRLFRSDMGRTMTLMGKGDVADLGADDIAPA